MQNVNISKQNLCRNWFAVNPEGGAAVGSKVSVSCDCAFHRTWLKQQTQATRNIFRSQVDVRYAISVSFDLAH